MGWMLASTRPVEGEEKTATRLPILEADHGNIVAYPVNRRREWNASPAPFEMSLDSEIPMIERACRGDSSWRWLVAAVMVTVLIVPNNQVAADQPVPSAATSGLVMGDAKKGESLYQASCVVCHGSRAEGGIGPRLAGNPIVSNDEAFWKIVHEGRHMMPPLRDAISDQQMVDIRAWLNTAR